MSLGAPSPPRSGPASKSRELSSEPLRWALPVCDDDSITDNSRTATPSDVKTSKATVSTLVTNGVEKYDLTVTTTGDQWGCAALSTDLLNIDSELIPSKYCPDASPSMAQADIKPEVHQLIHRLVLHIHDHEPDIEKSILIFLPTYYALEQQWFLLKPFSSSFKVHILHNSIDTEQALMSMKIWKSHRKVILATNIAESLVTIPKVAYVIDSCRSLQVFWNSFQKKEAAKLAWVSHSQVEQRRGRTGLTYDGQIYRLVTRPIFNLMEKYDGPSILRLSLRLQVLQICCAKSKAINDPKERKVR
ncbi:hypothetical protein ACFX2C_002986 [Malus domestica]